MHSKFALIAAFSIAAAGLVSSEPLDRSLMIERREAALGSPCEHLYYNPSPISVPTQDPGSSTLTASGWIQFFEREISV